MVKKKETELAMSAADRHYEQRARNFMKVMRSKGHIYIDLRKDGNNRFVYFCALCFAPCYNEAMLHEHLEGKYHKPWQASARLTLIGDNPWPFDDGLWFFDSSKRERGEERTQVCDGSDDEGDNVLISGLLVKDRRLDVEAKFIGFGRIAAKLFETKGKPIWIDKVWCEWLGEALSDAEKAYIPKHDFAIVTFSYFHYLGRSGLLDDQSCLQSTESANVGEEGSSRKRKRSTSDRLSDYNEYLMNKSLSMNKKERKKLKKQEKDIGKVCRVCGEEMIPGKDVATILNIKTRKFACSSRNINGVIHVFHVSCAVSWFLFCETEILESKIVKGKGKRRENRTEQSVMTSTGFANDGTWEIYSVFCPECQGTGINIVGDKIERDTFQDTLAWKFRMKTSSSRREWKNNPENGLEYRSTGLNFPQNPEDLVKGQEERVQYMKLVRFYRVD